MLVQYSACCRQVTSLNGADSGWFRGADQYFTDYSWIMSFYVWGSDIMKPRFGRIHSVCLLVTLLFLDSQESSAQHHIPPDWLGYWWLISCTDLNCYVFCNSEQLCLAVSLISTAANSAWDGEFRVKCRQGWTVVGWQEGTDGGKGKGYKVYTCFDTCEPLHICGSWLCCLRRMIHQSPTHVMSRESSEWLCCFIILYSEYGSPSTTQP